MRLCGVGMTNLNMIPTVMPRHTRHANIKQGRGGKEGGRERTEKEMNKKKTKHLPLLLREGGVNGISTHVNDGGGDGESTIIT